MAIVQVAGTEYHMANNLKTYWDKYSLKAMKKINRDKLDVVDGGEGLGKSTFVFQQMGYLDPKAFETPQTFVDRIAFTPEEFFKLVRQVKNGVIVFDEAFRGFSSRSALSKINKKLVQALMEMRQQNNIVFVVLPSIFLLDMYPAMLRSNALFNIYIDKRSQKRVWCGYNKFDKNKLYQLGAKKGWSYLVKSKFRGYFYSKFPGGEEYEKAYLKKKEIALKDMDTDKKQVVIHQSKSDLQNILENLYKKYNSYRVVSEKLRELGVEKSHVQVRARILENLG